MRFSLFRDYRAISDRRKEERCGAPFSEDNRVQRVSGIPEYQPIEKNGKIAKRAIFDLATFRSSLTSESLISVWTFPARNSMDHK